MTFNKAASVDGDDVAGLTPYDFSNIVTTHSQIKTVFRQNEMREHNFNEAKERGKTKIFKVLFRNK